MLISVLTERRPGERRVAIVPDVLPKLLGAGFEVRVQAGAGASAGFPDAAYTEAGALVVPGAAEAAAGADVLATVQAPAPQDIALLHPGAVVAGFLSPGSNLDAVRALAAGGVTSFAFELLPRISRAQSMDALSSQATVAGYRAVLLAAGRLSKFFPMLMTAAGTIPPAKVLVLGAGVAGLQAIATARRLGAQVSAYDVRPAAAEEVRSLGARFVDIGLVGQEQAGGYAAEQGAEFLARQQELLAAAVGESDVLITTAAVPGRPAPRLVSTAMIERMRPGSVVVDLAAATGGNCEPTRPGEEVEHAGVAVLGPPDLAATMPHHASLLYARNVANLLVAMVAGGEVRPDMDDEVLASMCITAGGEVRHAPTRQALASEPGHPGPGRQEDR